MMVTYWKNQEAVARWAELWFQFSYEIIHEMIPIEPWLTVVVDLSGESEKKILYGADPALVQVKAVCRVAGS